ncbi:MAG TPA: 16S rRNA (guanine(966)-N(2))-methyltransferase RsmD [Candidatus Eisenbacteria bacterium]|jgi:16S rRNA (guanine966-N2)-methyltransferase|nr:16S rRNA (guanine(966)-N(2))-methyltransferase RsmD [Candidatus Eisenbacteria bacterium]
MRVISGKAKGRRLVAPKGGAIRPTADRIKESLFNILPRDFSGMKILELFAGTGNISIEALSRGAESALLVDASERSARIIRENLRRLELTDRAQMWVMPVRRALNAVGRQGQKFDVIFLDPPYDQKLVGRSLELIASVDPVYPTGVVVAEHSVRETLKSSYRFLSLNDQRRYGDTLLSFFRHAAAVNSAVRGDSS